MTPGMKKLGWPCGLRYFGIGFRMVAMQGLLWLIAGKALATEIMPGPASGNQPAGSAAGGTVQLTNPLGLTNLQNFFDKVGPAAISIAIPIAAIMVLVGAFQMLTAAGDPEKFSRGRWTILYAAIGFVAVLLAGSIPQLIISIFSQ